VAPDTSTRAAYDLTRLTPVVEADGTSQIDVGRHQCHSLGKQELFWVA
jgi:hypothetical protein